jgi:hypothetical protein
MAETKEIQYTDLRFIPTGIVFHLPVNDAKEVLASDRGNFEVVGGVDITEDEEIIEETSTYNKVVGDDQNDDDSQGDENEPKLSKTALKAMRVEELVKLCEELKVEVTEEDKKANLIEKLLATNEE